MLGSHDLIEIDVDDRIAEKDHHLVGSLNEVARRPDGVPRTFAAHLIDKSLIDGGILLFDEVFDLLAEVADDKYKIADPQSHQLLHDKGNDGLTGNRDQRFRLGVGQRPELGSGAGHRYYGLHHLYEGSKEDER